MRPTSPRAPAQATPANLHVYEFDWPPDSKGLAYIAAADPPGENNWWVAKLYTQALGGAPKVILAPAETRATPRLPDRRAALVAGWQEYSVYWRADERPGSDRRRCLDRSGYRRRAEKKFNTARQQLPGWSGAARKSSWSAAWRAATRNWRDSRCAAARRPASILRSTTFPP